MSALEALQELDLEADRLRARHVALESSEERERSAAAKLYSGTVTRASRQYAAPAGQDLADAVLDLGYVRSDGNTLIAQPVLEPKRLWTIDDIRRCRYEVQRPPLPPPAGAA